MDFEAGRCWLSWVGNIVFWDGRENVPVSMVVAPDLTQEVQCLVLDNEVVAFGGGR